MLSVFSRRKILCASGSNHRYLLLILETINNIIQYQYVPPQAPAYPIHCPRVTSPIIWPICCRQVRG